MACRVDNDDDDDDDVIDVYLPLMLSRQAAFRGHAPLLSLHTLTHGRAETFKKQKMILFSI